MKRIAMLPVVLFILGCLPSDMELVAGSTTLHCSNSAFSESFDVLVEWDNETAVTFRLLNYDGYNGAHGNYYQWYVGVDEMASLKFTSDSDFSSGTARITVDRTGLRHIMHFAIWSEYEGAISNGANGKRQLKAALNGGPYRTYLEVEYKKDPINNRPLYYTVWSSGGTCSL
ncbi:MAG TPA: hypothetical protein VJL87_06800 [Bdellovibrionota bacterium]|nr:hypothetical protein [Bdellovibrionota bacterium]